MGCCCVKSDVKEHLFYWNSKKNPWDSAEADEWIQFDQNLQKHLNEKYHVYQNGGASVVKLIAPMDSYEVDFVKKVQFKSDSPSELRPILILDKTPAGIKAVFHLTLIYLFFNFI